MESTDPQDVTEDTPQPLPTAPPITSRFLFVDVAAMRAKQLRRGALLRLSEGELARQEVRKPERLAMEEVRRGLVLYDVPDPPKAGKEA